MAKKFVCPHWHVGQACKPFFPINLGIRASVAVLAASLALLAPALTVFKNYSAVPPTAAVAPAVYAWGGAMALAWLFSIILTLYTEKGEIWACFISAFGTPSLLVTLAALPQLIAV
jgi:hypothetical protein